MHKIKFYTAILAAAALVFLIALLWLTLAASPALLLNVLLFYLLFAGLVFCLSTLAGVYLRQAFGQREFLNQYLAIAMRQGLWFTILLAVSFTLLRHNLFTWINAGLLILTLVFLESYLLTKNDRQS